MSSSGSGLNKRRPSFPSSAPGAVLASVGDGAQASPPRIAWGKHLKYVALGGTGVWFFDVAERVRWVVQGKGWVSWVGSGAMGLHGVTVAIFLYLVLYLPWFRGYTPNQFARMRVLVPVCIFFTSRQLTQLLTTTILAGWTLYVVALSQIGKPSVLGALGDAVKAVGHGSAEEMRGSAGLGVWRAMAAATALYVLTLGCIGLIPTPAKVTVASKDV